MKKGINNIKFYIQNLIAGVLTRLRVYTEVKGFITLLLFIFFFPKLKEILWSFLSTVTVLKDHYYLLLIITTSIFIVFIAIVISLISLIFTSFKKGEDLAEGKFNKLNSEYCAISFEDLEVFAKNNGLYNKVPEYL